MARPTKIIQLGLEDLVLRQLDAGRTKAEIVKACNRQLAIDHDDGGDPPSVSIAAVKRYLLEKVPRETAAVMHRSQVAETNARLELHFGNEFTDLFEKVRGWVGEADEARIVQVRMEGRGEDKHEVEVDLGADWQARKVAASELRQLLGLYADMCERIYNARQIQQFQDIVMAAIEDADEGTAQRIRAKLAQVTEIRRAAMLGVAA